MGVLREIVASFAVKVDDQPLSKLDKRIEATKQRWRNMATVAVTALGAATFAAYNFVAAASRVEENLNILRTTFKGNSDAIIAWSRTFGKVVGRSEFGLQESVSKLGALLTTMLQGTGAPIDEMSKKLSELVVDLASFWNTTEGEALLRLQSGLVGETEAVRRYGVDISDAALRQEAEKLGLGGQYKNMDNSRKVLLRYQKILKDTALAQGDAAKTADSWANMTRRVSDQTKDLAVRMGQKLMPAAKSVLYVVSNLITAFQELRLSISNIFEAAMITGLSLTAAKLVYMRKEIFQAAKNLKLLVDIMWIWAGAQKLALLRFGLLSAAAAALYLIVEDTLGFFKGYDSALGMAITTLTGIEDPLAMVQLAWEKIKFEAEGVVELMQLMVKIAPDLALALVPGAGALTDVNKRIFDAVQGYRDRRQVAQEQFDIQHGPENVRKRSIGRIRELALSDRPAGVHDQTTRGLAKGFSDSQREQLYIQQRAQAILTGEANISPNDVALGIVPQNMLNSPIVTGAAALNEKGVGAAAAAAGAVTNNVTFQMNFNGPTDPAAVSTAVKDASGEAADALARRQAAAGLRN